MNKRNLSPTNIYIKKETYSLEEVLPFVVFGKKGRSFEKDPSSYKMYDGDLINMSSLRYQLFAKKGTVCVCCGLIGSFFSKEKFKNDNNFHFNLYGINQLNEEVQFTKDHILPKSKGGPDSLGNFQTMCYNCNQEKRDKV